jgi:teichuronic acid exporter
MGFVISIILARLLVPEDFGTIALLGLFLGIANLFVNAGFSSALVQMQETSHVDESTVFWFNIGAALIMTLLLFAISPWIAGFFSLPILLPLTKLMACNILIGSMGTVQGTLMTKRLNFKTPMKIGTFSTIVSGGAGVYMAWANYGVWALAAQALINTVVGTALLWYLSRWRPLFSFSHDSFKRLFGFGGWLFASWFLGVLYEQGYSLLIGKLYGRYDLGMYNRADSTQQTISYISTSILSRVALPLFSAFNHDKNKLQSGARLSVRIIMLITAPVMFGLATIAELFVRVVFGEQWLPATPILQILCFSGLIFPLHIINLNVLQAQGHANYYFRLEIIKRCAGILFLIAGSFFGLIGIALSTIVVSIISLVINGHYSKKFLDYGILAQIRDCMPSVLHSIIMGLILTMVSQSLELSMEGFDYIGSAELIEVLKLIVLIVIGAFIYLGTNILFRSRTLFEAFDLLELKK